MLLRSPSATTTGHPLRVYARLPVENKSFKPLRSTSVDVADSKRLSNNAMTPKKPLLTSKELSSHITARLTSTEAQAVTGAAVAAGANREPVASASRARLARVSALGSPHARRVPRAAKRGRRSSARSHAGC